MPKMKHFTETIIFRAPPGTMARIDATAGKAGMTRKARERPGLRLAAPPQNAPMADGERSMQHYAALFGAGGEGGEGDTPAESGERG